MRRSSEGTSIYFSPLPYDSCASQAFANLIKGPKQSLTLYVQHMISLLTQINHTSEMFAILASELNHYKIITGLNLEKLGDKLASACAPNWHTMADCFCNIKMFGESYE